MQKYTFTILSFFFCLVLTSFTLTAAEWSLERTDTGYQVLIDGKLFAGYVTDFKGTPIIWPIVGPTGQEMTRSYPMKDTENQNEKTDHEHHRSLWFNHGAVNGEDYWMISPSTIKHKQFTKAEKTANGALLITDNNWVNKAGEIVCSDQRTLRFGMTGESRFIDFDVTVTAVADNVVFGDTKEGSFGIRVPGRLDGDGQGRNKTKHPAGTIINAEGLKGDAAWGKQSPWVDNFGELENGDVVGITIMNHPKSYGYPTYWHVRTYGLFAANPFGIHDFVKGRQSDAGSLTLKKGDSFTLRYRVVFHKGTSAEADLPNIFEEYSKLP